VRSDNAGPASSIVLAWDGAASGGHSDAINGHPTRCVALSASMSAASRCPTRRQCVASVTCWRSAIWAGRCLSRHSGTSQPTDLRLREAGSSMRSSRRRGSSMHRPRPRMPRRRAIPRCIGQGREISGIFGMWPCHPGCAVGRRRQTSGDRAGEFRGEVFGNVLISFVLGQIGEGDLEVTPG
jgi:hypothetical protein